MKKSDFKLYRWWTGGKWFRYKLGRDTPPINLFTAWTQDSPDVMDMKRVTLIDEEDYRHN